MKFGLLIIYIFICFLVLQTVKSDTLFEKQMTNFAYFLVYDYNSLIKGFEVNSPDFDMNKRYFDLYSEYGYSYKILIVQSVKDNDGSYTLLFMPIIAGTPSYIFDYGNTFEHYYPMSAVGDFSILKNMNVRYNNAIINYEFGILVHKEKVLENPLEYAVEYADFIYKEDKNNIKIYKINEIWKPYIFEHNLTISNHNLWERQFDIEENITWNKDYTYNNFIYDFMMFNKTINHYEDFPMMVEMWNTLVSRLKNKQINMSLNNSIVDSLNNLRNQITNNESYVLVNCQEDVKKINSTFDYIIESKKLENQFPLKQLGKFLQNYFWVNIVLSLLGGVLIIKEIVLLVVKIIRRSQSNSRSAARKNIKNVPRNRHNKTKNQKST